MFGSEQSSDRVGHQPLLGPSKELDCVCCTQVQEHEVLISQMSWQSIVFSSSE